MGIDLLGGLVYIVAMDLTVQKTTVGKAVNDAVGFLKEVYEASKIVGLAAGAGAAVGGTMHESTEGAIVGGVAVGGLVLLQKIFFNRGLKKDEKRVAPIETTESGEPVFQPLPSAKEIKKEMEAEVQHVATDRTDKYRHMDIRWKTPLQTEKELAKRIEAADMVLEHLNNADVPQNDAKAYLDRIAGFDEARLDNYVQIMHELKKNSFAKWAEEKLSHPEEPKAAAPAIGSYNDVEDLLLHIR